MDTRRARYVAVTGAVGAGATTLATLLAQELGWASHLEGNIDRDNPFFGDAYNDFSRWGFASQVHFLVASSERHRVLARSLRDADVGTTIVEDRTPYEHTEAYVPANLSLGRLTAREATLLRNLTTLLEPSFLIPDLIVFREMSEADVLTRVRDRARPGEEAAGAPLLLAIRQAFSELAASWDRSPKLILPATLDLHEADGRREVVSLVRATLDGLDDVPTTNDGR